MKLRCIGESWQVYWCIGSELLEFSAHAFADLADTFNGGDANMFAHSSDSSADGGSGASHIAVREVIDSSRRTFRQISGASCYTFPDIRSTPSYFLCGPG
ncbi:MAG: hypothetical protein P4N24_16770 [Acidobacteriota bacterium]|nr:hypothetical protein [Acidobacteriota bacterium]